MLKMHNILLCSLLAVALSSPAVLGSSQAGAKRAQPTAEISQARAAQRADILAVAERYAAFRWNAATKNAHHGADAGGVRVDTPDVTFNKDGWRPDREDNVGMPYAWGGFSSIEEFKEGIDRGMYAGNIPASEHAGASHQAVGVDCSGFVSRCWDLPEKQSTRSLGSLCYELNDYSELLPGDVVNKFDGHVALFKRFVRAKQMKIVVIEAASLRVEENTYAVKDMRKRGFVPMRYRPLDSRWQPMVFGTPDLALKGTITTDNFLGNGDIREGLQQLLDPLSDAQTGEWIKYVTTSKRGEGDEQLTARLLVARAAQRVDIQQMRTLRDGKLPTAVQLDLRRTPAERLVDFLGITEPIDRIRFVAGSTEIGTFEAEGHELPAQHVTALIKASMTMRHKRYPMSFEIDFVLSEEAPVQGVLLAHAKIDITLGKKADEEPVIAHELISFRLADFGVCKED